MHSAIFNKFDQVDTSATRPYEGLRLGLYIVKNFTDWLGGKIEIESEPGKGSTFTLAIPFTPKKLRSTT
jgi:signal transduction histidine kinase